MFDVIPFRQRLVGACISGVSLLRNYLNNATLEVLLEV